ncbi:hypothetical protein CHUAL_012183 [Chamberlinius hualienensis]
MWKSTDFWLHTTPSKNCDIVVTFPPNTNEYTVMWLLTRLRERISHLEVHLRKHHMTGVYGLYLTCSWKGMYRTAETLRIRKRLKTEFGGGLKEFIYQNAHCYKDVEDRQHFFSSQERQSIILHILNSLRASEAEELNGIKFAEGQAIVPKCLAENVISQVFPLHNNDTLNHLQQIWVQSIFSYQPLDQICDYFGVKISMYFAWIGHYTTALAIPAIFGVILWICCYGNQSREDVGFVMFAFFNVIWTTVYLESWKRRQAELAYRWGTLDQTHELLAETRPLFRGNFTVSNVTGKMEPSYPNWLRNIWRYAVSVPVILCSLVVVCVIIFSLFELEQLWLQKLELWNYPMWLAYMPKILLALVIFTLDEVYHSVAVWLNDLENYRLEEEYENHLTIKMGVFQFVSAFISLFYIAFYLKDMEKLRDLLATLLITRQVVGNIKESVVPFLMGRCKLFYLNLRFFANCSSSNSDPNSPSSELGCSDSSNSSPDNAEVNTEAGRINITQAEHESNMYKYTGTFDDYLEMYIQFGYVMLFSSAFPMAAACAFFNNLIEIRSDAFKICCSLQRPFAVRVANIGAWQIMMDIMGVVAIIVNCALIGMSGQVQRLFPGLSTTGTVILIVVLEHILLAIKFGLAFVIPDIPEWVATEMAKVEYRRREALREIDHKETFKLNRSSGIDLGRNDLRTRSASTTCEFGNSKSPKTLTNSSKAWPDDIQVEGGGGTVTGSGDVFRGATELSSFSAADIKPHDLIRIPVSAVLADPSGKESVFRFDDLDGAEFEGLRLRKRNSLPSIDALADNLTVGPSSPPVGGSHPSKNTFKLKLIRKLSARESKKEIKEVGNRSSDEDEPLIRKPSRRFSLFSGGKR